MTFKEIFNQLESLGTEQNRKIYLRHGSGQNTYGVSFANLKKLAKGLGRDQELAVVLWDSENSDAQVLATMIMDPKQLDFALVEGWFKRLNYSLLVGLLAGVVAKASFAKKALLTWTQSPIEPVKEGGYSLLCHMLKDSVPIESSILKEILGEIKKDIHHSPNKIKAAMNSALIAIGTYHFDLTDQAIDVARQIGPIEVDHGDTNCKTPDAVSYIEKARKKAAIKKKAN